MTDLRPTNCRFRLAEEGKPYPRSSCPACKQTVFTGLGSSCSQFPDHQSEITQLKAQVEKLQMQLLNACLERETLFNHSGINDALQTAFEKGELTINTQGYVTKIQPN
jgi:hypothetical protein